MTPNLPQYLAECFSDDARALRERATKLGSARGPGPTAQQCRAMADACDRVSALFATAGAADDEHQVRALLPQLDQMEAAERDQQVRHVYAGAIRRVETMLASTDDGDDDDEDADDDDGDDD